MKLGHSAIILTVSIVIISMLSLTSAAEMRPLMFYSPLAPPAGSNSVFLPIIMKNFNSYTGPITPRYGPVCDNDPSRGQLYRDLVGFTSSFLQPLFEWTSVSCMCGLSTSQAAGTAFGAIAGRIVRIIVEIFNLIFEVIGSVVGILGSLLALLSGAAAPPEISCTGDAEGICLGLAAIVALDDMAGGLITLMVLYLIAVLSFYLGMYHIREVRSMMQPGGNDE